MKKTKIYLTLRYPAKVKLPKGQSWVVKKKVPADSPVVKVWFEAMQTALLKTKGNNPLSFS